MAKVWRNKSSTISLVGFEDFFEAVSKAEKNVDNEVRMCFEKCGENVYDELYKKAESAGLDNRLLDKIDEKFVVNTKLNIYSYEVGWKKQKPSTSNPLPDTYKVMFYNYGTPRERKTKSGQSRGKIDAHPKGSHGFIKKAKLAALRRNRKYQEECLHKILKDLEK